MGLDYISENDILSESMVCKLFVVKAGMFHSVMGGRDRWQAHFSVVGKPILTFPLSFL